MFHRRTSEAEAHGETATLTRRREGRGLGPFSGGQLTVIIVAALLAIAFPVGAWAVSGSNVFVTDATSGVHAKVTSTGQLQTHPNGPLTVNGSVTAGYAAGSLLHSPSVGGNYSVQADSCGSGTCQTLFKPPAGKAAVVT